MFPVATSHARAYQRSQPKTFLNVISGILMCIIVAVVFNVVLINAVFFPNCNRINRDCFLIEKMWGTND